ncbi:MAG: rhodoquinone biosynthesis methyltransferase RquA [Zoogloeaceae bacterium]|nr:rhodoquinone biosynthesis methyltransferase RquA [Zoogloeaceae bacterium]
MTPPLDKLSLQTGDGAAAVPQGIPDYLARTYTWAYLNARTLPWLDRSGVVSAILWGNARRLMRHAVAEFAPGQRVLQAACVYGDFSPMLARRVSALGALDVVDVAPLQVNNARKKLAGLSQTRVRQADLAGPDLGVATGTLDGAACFFLLHEVPEDARCRIVGNLLRVVRVGGKVVFTDYHRTHRWHPLAPVMALIFRWLEPFAPSLQNQEIADLSPLAADFEWHKTTSFGGLYQQVVAIRRR